MRNVIASLHPGEKASIEIIRQQKRIVINVRIRSNDHKSHHSSQKYEKPSPENKKEDISTKLGIKASNITSEIRNTLNVNPAVEGVIIIDINPDSQAAEEGIMPNDIILEINRKTISSTDDFKRCLGKVKPGDSVLFLLQRDNNTFYKAFKVR